MESDHATERARQRALVRRGYDTISLAYRSDDGNAAATSAEDVSRYAGWVAELASLLRPGARVVDLGCGAGIPATRELASYGLQVLGVDFSAVQLRRAQRLVPAARFVQADMAALGGYLLAIVGAGRWTGTAPYLGADMFWDHADTATYLRWLQAARLTPMGNRYIPEGQRACSRPGASIMRTVIELDEFFWRPGLAPAWP